MRRLALTRRRRQRGFTLLELMTVVALVGILATMAIGFTTDIGRRGKLNTVTREIYNGMNVARGAAIKRGQTIKVEINTLRLTAFVDSDNDHKYDSGEVVIYQYPQQNLTSPDNRWPSGMTVDALVLQSSNGAGRPVAIFDFEGFSIDELGDPVIGGNINIVDVQLNQDDTRRVGLTVAGALRILKE